MTSGGSNFVICLEINRQKFVRFKKYYGKSGVDHASFCSEQDFFY